MADSRGAQSGFARAFFPGLVLGLILGAFGGVFLSPYLNSGPVIPQGGSSTRRTPPGPRDEGGGQQIPIPEEGGTPQPAPSDTPAPSNPAPQNPPGEGQPK